MKCFRCLVSVSRQIVRPASINLIKFISPNINLSRKFCSKPVSNSQILSQQFDEPLKKYIEFTCKQCNTRVKKTFSKVAYEKGVVIIRCDGCESLHLVADNLGWIQDNKKWNIESIKLNEPEEEK